MLEIALNKHQLRTRETRERLLKAAEEIFVRDGYEGAELGEIAALAGRTKGAIYAHFKSKEDIFLALIEDHGQRARTQMEEALANSSGIEQNRQAMRRFLFSLLDDRSWVLLMLEFKLFSIRHPEAKEQLESYFQKMIPPGQEERYARILGRDGRGKNALPRRQTVRLIQPIISALALEAAFDPSLDREGAVGKVLDRIFDALF